MILSGLAAMAAGLPLAHRWDGPRAVMAAGAFVAGVTACLAGVIILLVPGFFVS